MSKTKTPDDLLTVALQDLRAGADLIVKRLPKIADHATDEALAGSLAKTIDDAQATSKALTDTGRAAGGSDNLWMDGILDDAKRDTKTIEQGPLLDTAMIGAVRKALAAALVSYDTVIALADQLGEKEIGKAVGRSRRADRQSDAALSRHLERIAGPRDQ